MVHQDVSKDIITLHHKYLLQEEINPQEFTLDTPEQVSDDLWEELVLQRGHSSRLVKKNPQMVSLLVAKKYQLHNNSHHPDHQVRSNIHQADILSQDVHKA